MSNFFSSFFNVADTSAPKKTLEQSYNETKTNVRVYKRQCERNKISATNNLNEAKKSLDKCVKEGNKKLGMMMMKKVKVYEAAIDKIDTQMQMADVIMIDLDNAKNAKLMGDLQASAATLYKQLNKQFSVEQIRQVTRNLEMQREKFKEKSEAIDDINNTLIDDMLMSTNDDDEDGSLDQDYEEYIEAKTAQEELEARAKIMQESSSSSSVSLSSERKPDYLDKVLADMNLQ